MGNFIHKFKLIMNTFIAAALATVTLAAVPKYLEPLNKASPLAEDCKYITEEEIKKAMTSCGYKCAGMPEPKEGEEPKKPTEEEMKAAKEKLEKMTAEEKKAAVACPVNCVYCTNYNSASTLALGAAAVVTAMALF